MIVSNFASNEFTKSSENPWFSVAIKTGHLENIIKMIINRDEITLQRNDNGLVELDKMIHFLTSLRFPSEDRRNFFFLLPFH